MPLAAVLWGSGISFGGVLAFLYADLIVLPLLDVYRRYYDWRMAAYIAAAFFATMVLSDLVMYVAFTALGLVPPPNQNIRREMAHFSQTYTVWLNIVFGALAAWLYLLSRKHPIRMQHHEGQARAPSHGEL